MTYETEPLPLDGGPLDGLSRETTVEHIDIPISPCDGERLVCIGRYTYDGWDKYEYQGHHHCGETVAERNPRDFHQPMLDSDMDRFEDA